MKNILFATGIIAVMALTSCYVGVEGGHRHRERRPHTAARIEIHTSNDAIPNDSLKSPLNPNKD